VETGEEVESWLSRMHNYFHVYNYSNELTEIMTIYNLIEKHIYAGKTLNG